MAKKKDNYYFDTFTKGIFYSNDAAKLLKECLSNYNPAGLHAQIEKMHKIEHAADDLKHEMMEQLMKEFLPPIEREDIVALAHTIDNVTDCIEDVLLRMYMFNIQSLKPEVMTFTDVILRCCDALKEMALELHNFKKPAILKERIIEINHLEEDGDRLYTEAMRRLYTEEKDPVAITAWTTMFERFEKCCDCCEDVADMVEQIIMKNN